MSKKKLVFICESLGGGVRRHLIDLLYNLDSSIFEIYLIYGTDERIDEVFLKEIPTLKENDVTFFQIKEFQREINFILDLKALRHLYKLLRTIKPDIVHCHSSKAGVIGRISAFFIGVKSIYYTPHGYYFLNDNLTNVKKHLFILVERILSKISKKNVHVSYGEENKAIEYRVLNKERSTVIFNGINKISSSIKQLGSGKIIIGTIARMDHQKNPWEFVNIAEKMCNENSSIEFWYIGDGELFESIELYIKSKQLEENIKLMGFKPNATNFLRDFDVFLSTSFYEGLPYTLIEAMSAGVPIVASDVTGNNEIVSDGNNGFNYELKNINEAVEKINILIQNKRLRKEIAIKAINIFDEKYSLDKMLSDYQKLYN
ncbi:glycosyltransferase family 4 protein [Cytobacillus firmus]|uniref:glycosyltransferase family 4 protein n=1 Tax=Cytobacillus pseudoceanisediminis TaxID=3051614 RepID=UPI00216306D8|nr:glycosyltransferase family 4 protein [Cytobacillus firmus]